MNKEDINVKFLNFLLFAFILATQSSCVDFTSSNLSSNSNNAESVSRNAFKTSLHVALKNQCATCHESIQSPFFAQADSDLAFDIITKEGLVNLSTPSSSYFLLKLAQGHNSFPVETINNIKTQIETWADAVENSQQPEGEQPVEFQVADASSILRKIKNVVHGGALTNEEWLNHYRSLNDKEALKNLVDQWADTEAGDLKLKFYLTMALNQDVTTTSDLFDFNINMNTELKESFARTALEIIKSDRPFTEIATTNRFAVNTRVLTAYAYQDRRDEVKINLQGLFNREGIDSDETDWRFVRFVQDDSEGPSASDLIHWRNVASEETVRFGIPRRGYFSTLAFQAKYPTNDDNQFRVTINQTLIGGLGKTFSPADATLQPQLIHMDMEHSPTGTQCFGCHRLMDPMRYVFRGKMDNRYRFSSEYTNEVSSFAVYNYVKELTKLDDLGEAIASHPDFHTAWTQKMCVALNANTCLETDPEFIRVANAFKNSNFKFKVLYRELVTSPLITGSERVDTNTIKGFSIARTRRTHFCLNADARRKQIQAARGVRVDTEDRFKTCIRIRDYVSSLGDDYTIRGLTHTVNSYPTDTFFRQATEQSCFALANDMRRRGSDVLGTKVSSIAENLDLIVQYLMGVPASHPRYPALRESVEKVYNYANNDLELDLVNSMAQVTTFACTSPDFTGVGL